MYIFVWNRPTVQCIAMIGPGGDKDTNMPVGRTRWDSWCPGCISQWNKSIGRPKIKSPSGFEFAFNYEMENYHNFFYIISANFANFPVSGISVTKALMARIIITTLSVLTTSLRHLCCENFT